MKNEKKALPEARDGAQRNFKLVIQKCGTSPAANKSVTTPTSALSPKTRAHVDILLSPSNVSARKTSSNAETPMSGTSTTAPPSSSHSVTFSTVEHDSRRLPSSMLVLPENSPVRRSSVRTLLYDGSSFTRWSNECASRDAHTANTVSSPTSRKEASSLSCQASTTSLAQRRLYRVKSVKSNQASQHVVDCKKLLESKAKQSEKLRYYRRAGTDGTNFNDGDSMTVVTSRTTATPFIFQNKVTRPSLEHESDVDDDTMHSYNTLLSSTEANNVNPGSLPVSTTTTKPTTEQPRNALGVYPSAASVLVSGVDSEVASCPSRTLQDPELARSSSGKSVAGTPGCQSMGLIGVRPLQVVNEANESPTTSPALPKRKLARCRTLTIKSEVSHLSTMKTLLSELEDLEQSLMQITGTEVLDEKTRT